MLVILIPTKPTLEVRQGRKRRGPHFVDAARHRVDRISGSIIRSGKAQLRQNRKLGAIVVRRSLPLIMTHRNPKIIRLATTAIAAVLALSSTQLLAQTAPEITQPETAAPATAVPDSAPAVTIPSEPLSTTASDPLAPGADDHRDQVHQIHNDPSHRDRSAPRKSRGSGRAGASSGIGRRAHRCADCRTGRDHRGSARSGCRRAGRTAACCRGHTTGPGFAGRVEHAADRRRRRSRAARADRRRAGDAQPQASERRGIGRRRDL